MDAPGICTEEKSELSCVKEEDCDETHWCRKLEGGEGAECTPFAQAGDECERSTPGSLFERCSPGLLCEKKDPDNMDEPGICTEEDSNLSCVTNEDCDESQWCRELAPVDGVRGQGSACTDFADVGESCGGFVVYWMREQCAPHLLCKPSTINTDFPGTCVRPKGKGKKANKKRLRSSEK